MPSVMDSAFDKMNDAIATLDCLLREIRESAREIGASTSKSHERAGSRRREAKAVRAFRDLDG